MADLPPLLQAALQLRAETSISRLFLPAMDDNNCPPLSLAAQAVLDAVEDDCIHPDDRHRIAAAALRAAADQCAEGATHWALYAIAAELEQLND